MKIPKDLILNPKQKYDTGHVHTHLPIPEKRRPGDFVRDVVMVVECSDLAGVGRHHLHILLHQVCVMSASTAEMGTGCFATAKCITCVRAVNPGVVARCEFSCTSHVRMGVFCVFHGGR